MPANPCVQFYTIGWLGAPIGAAYSNLAVGHATPLDEILDAGTSSASRSRLFLCVGSGRGDATISCAVSEGTFPLSTGPDGEFKLHDGAVRVDVNGLQGPGV